MGRDPLADRPVHVVGIGLHPYQRRSDTSYLALGLTAVRQALDDAGLACPTPPAATSCPSPASPSWPTATCAPTT